MKRFSALGVAVFTGLLVLAPLLAPRPAFGARAFPLACVPGKTCFILGYPDLDATPGQARDYTCGPGAEDGDVFLHIGLPDVTSLALKPAVIAVDDGVVKDANDGLPDLVAASKRQLAKGTPVCGNGVVIKHADGSESAYCHLRRGSVTVKPGQHVRQGDVIGTAGQSGVALWPQLAFTLRRGGYFIDPMTGATTLEGCGGRIAPEIEMPAPFDTYQPAAITALGFANQAMDAQQVALGRATRFAAIEREERRISLWGMIVGLRAGDEVETRIRDPRGRTIFHETYTAAHDTPRVPVDATITRGFIGWRSGLYSGEVAVTRTINLKSYTVSRNVSVQVE
ncbi:MAG: M23 family metallopeptidase [Rhodospirillales bacterium]|nr:M23 family metallopeptidase [Alphaproteobacteria bacterium]MCB9987431.1 M23 family metallopeptidase [Rhodospirillales bacterium]USO07587.1 MAG: M23 family metallopeptidase [Rhodospirillales bacterium]